MCTVYVVGNFLRKNSISRFGSYLQKFPSQKFQACHSHLQLYDWVKTIHESVILESYPKKIHPRIPDTFVACAVNKNFNHKLLLLTEMLTAHNCLDLIIVFAMIDSFIEFFASTKTLHGPLLSLKSKQPIQDSTRTINCWKCNITICRQSSI